MSSQNLPKPDYAKNMRLIGHSDQGGRPDGELRKLLLEFLDIVGGLGAEVALRPVNAGAVAGPGLLRRIARRDEENVAFPFRRPGAEDRHRVGLAEAREIPEVGVLAIRIRRALDRGLGRRAHHRDSACRQLGDEARAMGGEEGGRRGRRRRGRESGGRHRAQGQKGRSAEPQR